MANPHLERCPHCGGSLGMELEDLQELEEKARRACGTALDFCPACGLEDAGPYCPTCGGCPSCCDCPGVFFRPGDPEHG